MRVDNSMNRLPSISFSLLWEDTSTRDTKRLSDHDMEDMTIEALKEYMEKEDKIHINDYIQEYPVNQQDTLYRQGIMYELLEHSDIMFELYGIGEEAYHLLTMSRFAFEKEATVYNLMKRMEEVLQIHTMMNQVIEALEKIPLASKGLRQLHAIYKEIITSSIYEAFLEDVNHIKTLQSEIKSMKIGLNLDEYLQPMEAILLELSEEEFKYSRLNKKMEYYIGKGVREVMLIPRKIFAKETIAPPDALNQLEKIIEPAMLQLIRFCDQFIEKILEYLSVMKMELPYYIIGYRHVQLLKKRGHSWAFPSWKNDGNDPNIESVESVKKVRDNKDIQVDVTGLYNLQLGYTKDEGFVVGNYLRFTEKERILILTGANRGGKTTITTAMAQCLWFAQLGYPVSAKEATLPYVSGIYMHFPREEKETVEYGRLGEECRRFRRLYDAGDAKAFYFMNESFSGTSHHESLQIALETLHAIYDQGSYVMFNTHLHELPESIRKEIPDLHPLSLIAGKDMENAPYIIEEGEPLGRSYAKRIADQYGMSYERLMNQ